MYEESPETLISLDAAVNTANYQKHIARTMLRQHGQSAYMMVLMELDSDKTHGVSRDHWRTILKLMEEIEKEPK
jgi:hypothetical protein